MPLIAARWFVATSCATATLLTAASPAGAQQLVLSSLIVELQAGKTDRDDIEVLNRGTERAFIAVSPREVTAPGTASQSDREERDPEKLGLLVSPDRMILEPGQRKLVRLASLAADANREHVYRVTFKPVAGQVQSAQSGLKVLIGYDVLVLVRPLVPRPQLVAARSGDQINFRNEGNVSLVLHGGKQCDASGKCSELPSKRIYAGAVWSTPIKATGPITYVVDGPGTSVTQHFN